MEDMIDKMNLPMVNPNEDLETISRNSFKKLFDITLFEIRDELQRDKGIDFSIELKKHEKYLNFRSLIQLKSTKSIEPNADGSYSVSIDTSNIQYLLNNGYAYYFLYVESNNTFYYENINSFFRKIYQNSQEWGRQQSHVLRFSRKFQEDSPKEIYEEIYRRALFSRILNDKLSIKSNAKNNDKIVIDADLNITGDEEIRKTIEEKGIFLFNEGKWKEIIKIHTNATGNVATSGKYNFILGLANYYLANYIDSLSFFKKAETFKIELHPDIINLLEYFYLTNKYIVGIISEEEYSYLQNTYSENPIEGLYIKVQDIKKNFNPSREGFLEVEKEFLTVLNDPKCDKNIELLTRCEMIHCEGLKNNADYLQAICYLNHEETFSLPIISLRVQIIDEMKRHIELWTKNVSDLINQCEIHNKQSILNTALLYKVKILYEDYINKAIFQAVKFPLTAIHYTKIESQQKCEELLPNIEAVYSYFNQIGDNHNVTVALTAKYEILHYLEKYDEANKIMAQLKSLVFLNDMKQDARKIEFLSNKGTTHEQLISTLKNIQNN